MLFWTSKSVRETSFLLLLLSWSPARSIASFADWYAAHNPLDIDISPAPPPELGPPLSKGASRDKALLPFQIAGIVGAYILSVFVVGLGILIIAKTTRKQFFRLTKRARDIELAEAQLYQAYGGYTGDGQIVLDHRSSQLQRYSSVKDIPNFSHPSPNRQSFKSEDCIIDPSLANIHTTGYSLGGQSVTSLSPREDNIVWRADREKMDRNLEDIYAHVMAQEEAKEQGLDVKSLPKVAPGGTPISPMSSPRWSGQAKPEEPLLPPAKGKKKPQQLNLDEKAQKNVKSPSKTATFMHALKSPFSALKTPKTATPHSATAPEIEPVSPRHYITGPLLPTNPSSHNRMISNPSIAEQLSSTNTSPDESYPPNNFPSSPTSVQSLRVSLRDRDNATPRQGNPSSQPTDIPSARNNFHQRLTPPMSPTTIMASKPTSAVLPGVQTLHSIPTPISSPSVSHYTKPPSAHTNPHAHTNNSASNPTGALPFRAYDTTLSSTTSPTTTTTFATPATKTTVLERTEALSPSGPKTGGLPRTPWTAGAVPYSPYMPNTPMMPITPRLVTREERKMARKRDRKEGLRSPVGPVVELVRGEGEVWDSGY